MKIIGITGTSGSGKGYVSDLLRSFGYKVIDSDRLCHELYETDTACISEIRETFGDVITDGKVDRSKLSGIVFSDAVKLKKLNSIAHKYVLQSLDLTLKELEQKGEKTVFIDAPQLFESGLDKKCSYIIAVTAPDEEKIQRIIKRDGIGRDAAVSRLSNQYDNDFFLANSNFVINNDGTEDVTSQVTEALSSILEDNNE